MRSTAFRPGYGLFFAADTGKSTAFVRAVLSLAGFAGKCYHDLLDTVQRGGSMARITVEDCQERVNNRFLLVQMAIKRVHQYREGYEPQINTRNKECVTALREIAAGKVRPDDDSLYTPLSESEMAAASGRDYPED